MGDGGEDEWDVGKLGERQIQYALLPMPLQEAAKGKIFKSFSHRFRIVIAKKAHVFTTFVHTSPIHTDLSVRESCGNSPHCCLCEHFICGETEKVCCGSDLPPEVVSEPQQRPDGVCVNGKAGGTIRGVSV